MPSLVDMKLFTAGMLTGLSEEAARSARLRKNLNVHPVLEDPVQRLFNAMEPGTYARPHRHSRPDGWELMVVVRGAFSVLRFDDHGRVVERVDLRADGGDCAVEIPAGSWHTVVSRLPGTVMFEVKPGPYSPIADKDFAAWAPEEGSADATALVRRLESAQPGDRVVSTGCHS
ncbi:WbuC family cupin fold metalloprotein [Methylococcus sp. ANG]|uniref:WbuC family cupin fold metalloprotein n=1 Tax=Methylococcus sp. ANG TaxID=3231903 RepID=UPI003457D33B